ncbi:MAG TPA: hypothetical protein VLT59_00485 [Steroidobacteraceae bacterium]|nr:hypothetical protein [Steroidobacteraceae bacterium]
MTLKTAICMTLLASAVALAAPGGDKGPPEGKGNKPSSEVGNNLSVPAIIAGGTSAFPIACGTEGFTDLLEPDKGPVYYAESCAETHDGPVCRAEGNYYVQRDAKWQAPCLQVLSADASAKWGDNLAGGDAKLKVGSPIRVELVLWESTGLAVGEQGYLVIKLEPDELDRLSDYGHLARGSGTEGDPFAGSPYAVGDMLPDGGTFGAVVHDPDARLTIEQIVDGIPVSTVYDGKAGAEINATGKVVYGHNLRVSAVGTYRITYTMTNVNITGCDVGDCTSGKTVVLPIEVISGGGGGGGKPTRP